MDRPSVAIEAPGSFYVNLNVANVFLALLVFFSLLEVSSSRGFCPLRACLLAESTPSQGVLSSQEGLSSQKFRPLRGYFPLRGSRPLRKCILLEGVAFSGSILRVEGFRVEGLGLKVYGLWFRVRI